MGKTTLWKTSIEQLFEKFNKSKFCTWEIIDWFTGKKKFQQQNSQAEDFFVVVCLLPSLTMDGLCFSLSFPVYLFSVFLDRFFSNLFFHIVQNAHI